MIYQVLIVDDEEIVCRGLAEFVKWQAHGFEVAGTACSVDQALLMLQTTHVDVIFMDIKMPEKSGLELLPVLQEKYADIKTVILSGYSDFAYAREALRYGAFEYLTKPVILSEMDDLLDRLHDSFDRQQQLRAVHDSRMEALLLSSAKGYSLIDPQKLALPNLEHWFGFSMTLIDRQISEEKLLEKKAAMRSHIRAMISSSILLDADVYSLFALIPCRTEQEMDSFLTTLDQLCPDLKEWGCGASFLKNDIGQLAAAWQESDQAMRFLLAHSKEGIMLYKSIETVFSQELPSMQSALTETLHRLADPAERNTVPSYIQDSLLSVLRTGFTLTQFQTVCIRFLIELNGHPFHLNLPEEDLHTMLNKALSIILLCQSYQAAIDCMARYMEWLVKQLNLFDAQNLGTGVIREIQLFIRQHYNENITLNYLAEHFYLHSNYLSKLFKDKTGKNFIEYLTEVRMEQAKKLLQSTDYKIIEICAMTGYDNPRYFSRLFKNYTGITPREFREKKLYGRTI